MWNISDDDNNNNHKWFSKFMYALCVSNFDNCLLTCACWKIVSYTLRINFLFCAVSFQLNDEPAKYHHLHVHHSHFMIRLYVSECFEFSWNRSFTVTANKCCYCFCYYFCSKERPITLFIFSPIIFWITQQQQQQQQQNQTTHGKHKRTHSAADFQNNNEQIGVTNTNALKKAVLYRFVHVNVQIAWLPSL